MWKISLYLCLSLCAANLTLVNDSSFPLMGEVINAAGDKVGSVKLNPGQSYIWYSDESPFQKQYDRPTTPFTVRFLCIQSRPYDYNPTEKNQPPRPSYQSEFGVWPNVPTGATINALGAPNGTKSCVIKKEKKSASAPRPAPSAKNQQNSGFNNWSNDGGQTWTNDADTGWIDGEDAAVQNK